VLTNIDQLEKDIETFRKNIESSNQIYAIFKGLIDVIKIQNALFESESKKIVDIMLQSNEDIGKQNKDMMNNNLSIFKEKQEEFNRKSADILTALDNGNVNIEDKYSKFLQKLSETNMDQIYKLCLDIKKTTNMKINILSGGLAVTIVLLIVSIFII
jgi:hypothetical protein